MRGFLVAVFLMLSIPWAVRAAALEIGEREFGKRLVVAREDLLTVTLPANPSTGYCWTVSSVPAGLLREIGKPAFEPRGHRAGMVGVGGWQRWRFRAATPGQALLAFSYSRPWEHGVAPARLIRWPVTIGR
jgi:inhibitor of cysteine peptidase